MIFIFLDILRSVFIGQGSTMVGGLNLGRDINGI